VNECQPLVVGSELIQKYLGDGPKLVRELFRVVGRCRLTLSNPS
jgi:ATP-dependent 26S proteasome regulatory subunit